MSEISLHFNTVRIAAALSPSIRVVDQTSNKEIRGDVFGCEIILWNSGNLPLGEKSDRKREPITIIFSEDARLIDATVQETKNVSASGIKIERYDHRISVSWLEFDPGDAVKIFVVYESDGRSPIEYRGRFVQTEIKNVVNFRERVTSPSYNMFSAMFDDIARHPLVLGTAARRPLMAQAV
jgi:hypothetical protein